MAKLQPAILFSQYSQYSLLFPLISCGNNPFIRCTVTIMLFSSVSIFSWLLGCLWPCHHPACHPSRSSTYLISLFFFTGLDFDWIYLLFALVYLIIWTNVQSKETGIVSKFGKLDFSFFFFLILFFPPKTEIHLLFPHYWQTHLLASGKSHETFLHYYLTF